SGKVTAIEIGIPSDEDAYRRVLIAQDGEVQGGRFLETRATQGIDQFGVRIQTRGKRRDVPGLCSLHDIADRLHLRFGPRDAAALDIAGEQLDGLVTLL